MFEKLKGVKKGTTIAEKLSESIMNVVNYLVLNEVNMKTHDTLTICSYFYFYCRVLIIPKNIFLSIRYGDKSNKSIKFIEAADYQTKKLLEEWLNQATGLYELDTFISTLEPNSWEFFEAIIKKYNLGDGAGAFSQVKSYVPEEILINLADHFQNDTTEFKNIIGKQLENLRIAL